MSTVTETSKSTNGSASRITVSNLNMLLMVCMIGFMGWLTTTTLSGAKEITRITATMDMRFVLLDRLELKIDNLQLEIEAIKLKLAISDKVK